MEIKFDKMNAQTDLGAINNSLRAANISQKKIIDYIYENRPIFKNYLMMKQNMNYLYELFLIDFNKIECYITENIEKENNQEILQPLFNFVRSKMEEISKIEKKNVVLSYLRIVLLLMKKANYPHDKNLNELNFFIKYKNECEFIQISSYVGNPIILSIYDQKFPQKEEKKPSNLQAFKDFFTKTPLNQDKQIDNNNFPSSDFFNIVKIILSSSDSVIDQFINKPNICEIVSKSVSKIKTQSEIDLITRFIKFLKERQNKYPAQISKIFYAIITGNDTNIQYIISISEYFNELISNPSFQEIAGMLRIVDAIMKNGSNKQNDVALQYFTTYIFSYLQNNEINLSKENTSLLTLNPDYILHYLSENSSVINITIHLLTKIASLNLNFKKESEKVLHRNLYILKSNEMVYYHCAAILVYYCFNDPTKKENDIVKYLTEMCKYLSKFQNEKWRNIFFKAFLDFVYNSSQSVQNWAKLLANEAFKFASLTCDNEKKFYTIIFNEMNDKDISKFLFSYSNSFSSSFYKMAWITSADQKTKAINQLEQVVFLLKLFPDERSNIIQLLDIKKEWFKSIDFSKYKKLILEK